MRLSNCGEITCDHLVTAIYEVRPSGIPRLRCGVRVKRDLTLRAQRTSQFLGNVWHASFDRELNGGAFELPTC